jgi:hypothetical protein
MQNKVEQN